MLTHSVLEILASIISVFKTNENFEDSKRDYQLTCIRNASFNIFILLIIMLISTISSGLETIKTSSITILLVLVALTTALHIMTYRKCSSIHKLMNKFFTLYLIAILLAAFYAMLNYLSPANERETYIGGLVGAYVISIAFLTKLNWVHILIILLIETSLAVWISFIQQEDGTPELKYDRPLVLIVVCLILVQISIRMEISERELFVQREKKSKTLESLKLLINSSLLDQIFILPKDVFTSRRMYFHNEAASKWFLTRNTHEFIYDLERLNFEESNVFTDKFYSNKVKNIKDYIDNYSEKAEHFKFVSKLSGLKVTKRKKFARIQGTTTRKEISDTSNLLNPGLNTINNANILGDLGPNSDEFDFSFSTEELDENEDNEEVFEVNLWTMPWEEGQRAIVVMLRNITEQKKLMKLEELHEFKDQMLANVSHDLRTPLNGIIGILQSVTPNIQEIEVAKMLDLAINSANSLLFLINDLLDISQMKKGQLSLNFSKYRIRELVEPVVKLIEYTAAKKNLQLIIEDKTSKELHVLADNHRFQQILLNLLGNAVKFTRNGFVKLTISEEKRSEEDHHSHFQGVIQKSMMEIQSKKESDFFEEKGLTGVSPKKRLAKHQNSYVYFTVEDSGIGIKKEDQSKLFKPYGKLKNSVDNPSGVGLGLIISNSLVQRMNPKLEKGITVFSEYGKGSKFSFCLEASYITQLEKDVENLSSRTYSLIQQEAGPIPHFKEFETVHHIKNGKLKKTHVLIVDDDQINLLVVQSFLSVFPTLNCTTANNGVEALEAIEALGLAGNFFEIIFMDCNMPLMNGFDCTEKINQMVKQKTIEKPIIYALTGYNSEKETNKCKALGMNVLTKPLNRQSFQSMIQGLLS